MTLRQLMGHLAGVRNDGGDEGPLLAQRCARTLDGVQFFAKDSLLFEPGTRYRYSSYGWIVVSAAVEAAAGEALFTFMRKQVFEPLVMDDTGPDSATEAVPDRATSYFPRFAGDPRHGLHLMRPIDFLLRRLERLPVNPDRPRALRSGDEQRQAAATRHSPTPGEYLLNLDASAKGDATGHVLRFTVE